MAGPHADEEQEKPLDPAVERVRRKLVRFVAINLGLLFLALMAVVVAIVYRANRVDEPPRAAVPEIPAPAEGAAFEGEVTLPAGSRILGHAVSDGRVSLHVAQPDGTQAIVVYDVAQARIVGRLTIGSEE